MKKFYFIVNPISGHANNTKYAEDIIALLHKKADVETHMHVLQARGEAEPYAAKLADEIKDDGIIVSVGGDGTFNEIASSLVGKSTPVAIIPRGSGNGLARMLRVPTQKALQAEYLLKGHTIKIDNGNFGDRKYFCTAGFGFEACIAFLFDKTGNKKRGRQQYVQHIIKEIFNYKPVEAELEIDGKREKGKYFSLCIANANQYGNNAIISPSADLTDGKLRLIKVKPFPLVLAGTLGVALMGGYIDKLELFVETKEVESVKILSISDDRFHCDGEPIRKQLPLEVSITKGLLNILVDADYKPYSPRIFDVDIDDINAKIRKTNENFTETLKEKVEEVNNLNYELRSSAKDMLASFFTKKSKNK